MARTAPLLELIGLSKSFGGVKAIDDLSLVIADSGVTSLVGPNGAGKTTLFNLITGFLVPDRGRIMLRGRDITRLPPYKVARAGVARTFQNLRLFPTLTVFENVAVACEASDITLSEKNVSKLVDSTLERVGLLARRDVRVADLSFAEQKFVSLARAIVRPANLLLLDEPAAGLDGRALERFHQIVRSLAAEGRSVLLIEHNLDTVRGISDSVAFLDQGRLIATGTPGEIFAMEELAALYFGDDR